MGSKTRWNNLCHGLIVIVTAGSKRTCELTWMRNLPCSSLLPYGLLKWQEQMRKHNKSRPTKKTAPERKSPRKSAAPRVAAASKPMKLNFVAMAPMQVEQLIEGQAPRRRSPLGFWTAFLLR